MASSPRDASLRPPTTARNGTAPLLPARAAPAPRRLRARVRRRGDRPARPRAAAPRVPRAPGPDDAPRLRRRAPVARAQPRRTRTGACARRSGGPAALRAPVVAATPTSVGLACDVERGRAELETVCEAVFHERRRADRGGALRPRPRGRAPRRLVRGLGRPRARAAPAAAAPRARGGGRAAAPRGPLTEASQAALAALAADPLRESAHRLLIRAALEEGKVAEALRRFTGLRAELLRELGLEPSEQTRELLGGLVVSSSRVTAVRTLRCRPLRARSGTPAPEARRAGPPRGSPARSPVGRRAAHHQPGPDGPGVRRPYASGSPSTRNAPR